jgi:hypothetical protein
MDLLFIFAPAQRHLIVTPPMNLGYAVALCVVLLAQHFGVLFSAAQIHERCLGRAGLRLEQPQSRHRECLGLHGRFDAGRDRKTARAGKGTRAPAFAGPGARAGIRTPHRRSHAQHAHRAAARERHRRDQLHQSRRGRGAGHAPAALSLVQGNPRRGDSDLTQMLTACLRDGKTFHRGEVEHITRDGEVRRLGVTISPIYRPVRNLARAGAAEASPRPVPT